ncbi:thioesterase family protein [Terasakiella sp. SH-1]|uniref:thioesterase family protein n=1 Tax=Terasakiella sp. SH-1 TaxID=2560057 RepID=UPI001072FDA6|nr:thioesterase family protein [Terasakiella sp. SH-1]
MMVHEETVKADWIDYNGHMNVAYYVLVFDHATDTALNVLKLGDNYRKKGNNSFFVVETHVTYEQEVKKDELLVVKTKLLGYDTKRLHLFHEMFVKDGDVRCASNEVMALHVDMDRRKAAEIPVECRAVLQNGVDISLREGWPESCGRSIKKLKNIT